MRAIRLGILFAGCVGFIAGESTSTPRVEPVLVSLYPFTAQSGSTLVATLRGTGLRQAKAAFAANAPFRITVEGVESEPPVEGRGNKKAAMDLVRLRIEVPANSKPGRYSFRLIAAGGISNTIPLRITEHAVIEEPAGTHETPDSAVQVAAVPSVFAGRLSRRGETDYYAFHAKAGQTLTFDLISGLPQIAAAGSASTIPNFDPSLTIYEASGSWFDPHRLIRVAYNDEPVWVFGKSTDAHLVQRFQHDGTFLMRVEAFAGQGGPDYGYHLAILPGEVPQDLPPESKSWEERGYTRALSANRLNQLAVRGGASKKDRPAIETYRTPGTLKLPATLEGTLTHPGEAHRASFQVDGPSDIAIEVETPAAAPPFFNPIVRLLNAEGEEVATNILAGRGACNGALTKSLQAKTIVPLRNVGVYSIEVRDATADMAGQDFRYRVQVRPQVPHIGQVKIDADHVNLAPEEAKTIRIAFDREEDYRGGIAIMAESLPAGVQAVVGSEFEPEKDPPQSTGKRERYQPRGERAILVLTAAADAAPTAQPQMIRIVVRPLTAGKMGEAIATKSIPVMVIPKS